MLDISAPIKLRIKDTVRIYADRRAVSGLSRAIKANISGKSVKKASINAKEKRRISEKRFLIFSMFSALEFFVSQGINAEEIPDVNGTVIYAVEYPTVYAPRESLPNRWDIIILSALAIIERVIKCESIVSPSEIRNL